MRALVELAGNGGYVCAEYWPQVECALGYIKPGSKIELVRGRWGDWHDYSGREAVLKCLSVSKVKLVSPSESAVIFAARPRQGTIMRWRLAGKVIEALVERRQIKPSFELLSPAQQEVMCSEFLRLREAKAIGLSRIAHLVLTVGRTLKAIDIYGITETGKKVFAQVTYRHLSECREKLRSLRDYRDGASELILFCDCAEPVRKGEIAVIPIRTVYETFTSTSSGKKWLKRAIAQP